jgi:hypothetical protein
VGRGAIGRASATSTDGVSVSSSSGRDAEA